MKLSDLTRSGHWPTLLTAFLYFAVALPQAGRWYPPNLQGVVMGLAGAGNIGVVLDSLLAPRLAEAFGWKNVFGFALVPALLVLICYAVISKEAPGRCADLAESLP